MKFTWNWLKELVDVEDSPAEVGERLTMAGLEVDAVEPLGQGLEGVFCAEVTRLVRHPNADALRVVDVACGGVTHTVVCGAPNVAIGQRVAFASPGSRLPGGTLITATEIRGVASAGMLCSEVELGVGDDDSGLLVLPTDASVGALVASVLGLDDLVLELGITPNRGDCLSVLGIAREVAALTGARLRPTTIVVPEGGPRSDELVAIRIDSPDLCHRYVGRVLSDVKLGPSPFWMRARLRAVGIRPINNVVDITNYVLIERGQPLHAFDLDRLPAPEITVRRAAELASMRTLDGEERQLVADDLLITSGGQPVALAGVMGGGGSAVVDGTTRLLLESAWFDPSSVRRTSKRTGLRSESSYRFERRTDPLGVEAAADRAAQLMVELAGASVATGRCVAETQPYCAPRLQVRLPRVAQLLGVTLASAEVQQRLAAFAMLVEPVTADLLEVTPPSYRGDIEREVDVIEELARSLGYENIPSTLPTALLDGAGHSVAAQRQRSLRRQLAALGLDETVSIAFVAPESNQLCAALAGERTPVEIVNPLVREESQMRLSLLPGLLQVTGYNLDRGAGSFAGFALGKVFWREGEGFAEARHLGLVVCSAPVEKGVGVTGGAWDFAEVKGVVETLLEGLQVGDLRWTPLCDLAFLHPGQSARVSAVGRPLGIIGAVHPSVCEAVGVRAPCWVVELDLESVLDYQPTPVVFEELPRFPSVVRDLALVAEVAFESDRVAIFVQGWPDSRGWIEKVELFDQYVGPPIADGKKSLAYSISYRARERTLTDAEVNEVHTALVSAVEAALPVEMR